MDVRTLPGSRYSVRKVLKSISLPSEVKASRVDMASVSPPMTTEATNRGEFHTLGGSPSGPPR